MTRASPQTSTPPKATRDALLEELLRAKPAGLTLDELAGRLGVTRTAVRQQDTALERDGLVVHVGSRPSGRRPSRTYGLTHQGLESFPRRYDLLSLNLFRAIRERVGDDTAEEVLMTMADDVAAEWLPYLVGLDPEARRAAVVTILDQLGYHAAVAPGGVGVAAVNCVFHNVANETRAVCRFDERLVSLLLGEPLGLTSCMADGESSCVFARLAEAQKGQGPP